MTSLSDLSDAELEAIAAGDQAAFARATAARHGVRPELVMSVRQQESGGDAGAISPKGARGVMQLMPGTAKDLGVDPNDPYQNIEGGVRYLKKQLDDFGGDERLALAAYNAGPEAVRKHGGVPPYAETQGYVKSILGDGAADPRDISQLSDAELEQIAGQATPAAPPPAPGSVRPPQRGATAPELRPDDALGFIKGAFAPADKTANRVIDAVKGTDLGDSLAGQGAFLRRHLPKGLVDFIDDPQGFYDAQAAKGVRPGKLGEFAGNVAGLSFIPGGPLTQGAVGGALMSDADTAEGVAKDAAIGGLVGRVAAGASDAVQLGARQLLSKAPKVMSVPQLRKAVSDAYAKVDASGFSFPKADIKAMADDFANTVKSMPLSKAAKDDAREVIGYARGLANGDLPLNQLEKFRGDIYDILVSKGGDAAKLGRTMRAKIDALIDAVPNGDVRAARELKTRLAKAEKVTTKLDSGELRGSALTGKNTERAISDKLRPLIDPDSPQRILNATKDEAAAIRKVVSGGGVPQKVASTVGALADPRRLLSVPSSVLSGGAALHTAGLSLALPLAGLFGSAYANRAAQKGVQDALRLIAGGGSKQALAKVPTKASYATEKVIAGARPAVAPAAVVGVIPQRRRDRK